VMCAPIQINEAAVSRAAIAIANRLIRSAERLEIDHGATAVRKIRVLRSACGTRSLFR